MLSLSFTISFQVTEVENMMSLQRFKQDEAAKKKQTMKKNMSRGQYIRYISKREQHGTVTEARNFLMFTDVENFFKVCLLSS